MRTADIDIRVGTPEFDLHPPLRDSGWFNEETHFEISLPIEDDPLAIQSALWLGMIPPTVQESGESSEFEPTTRSKSKRKTNQMTGPIHPSPSTLKTSHHSELDIEAWQRTVMASTVALKYLRSGILLRHSMPEKKFDISSIQTETKSDKQFMRFQSQRLRRDHCRRWDGGSKSYDYIDAHSLSNLPSEETIAQMMHTTLLEKVTDLRKAPVVDPYVGPAILRGRAAAVFFHEILGHRAEGHRQKDDTEGQTLTDKVNESIFPKFITVIDDPTLQNWEGLDLNGYYRVDDEGVEAQKVVVVEDGILRNFLMSRSPIED